MKLEGITFTFHQFGKEIQNPPAEILNLINSLRPKPQLIISLGQNEENNKLQFEQCGYDWESEEGKAKTKIDCDELSKRINEHIQTGSSHLKCEKTEKYRNDLCSFSFFISLCKDEKRTMAVYVPNLQDRKVAEALLIAV